jgi:hypothetical protein
MSCRSPLKTRRLKAAPREHAIAKTGQPWDEFIHTA